jgi:hypothetical protein
MMCRNRKAAHYIEERVLDRKISLKEQPTQGSKFTIE